MIDVVAVFAGDDPRIDKGERCKIRLMGTHTGMTLAYIEAVRQTGEGPDWVHVASAPYSLIGFLTNWHNVQTLELDRKDGQ